MKKRFCVYKQSYKVTNDFNNLIIFMFLILLNFAFRQIFLKE